MTQATRATKARRVSITASVRGVTSIDRIIGKRLRARRLERHMSQQELANRLGLTFQQVQKYEKGVNRIGSARLVQIAAILEVNTSYFLDDLKSGNGKESASRFIDFLATTDGVAINEAMMKLGNAHRRGVIDLARTLVRAYTDFE
jgi:transcriptional regulator with XRE-family HTH domain